MAAAEVFDDDAATGRAVRCDSRAVTPPHPNVMTSQRQIASGRERAISSSEYGDAHDSPVSSWAGMRGDTAHPARTSSQGVSRCIGGQGLR